jgi:ribosomal protein S12 methylthiotransferase accessory factor
MAERSSADSRLSEARVLLVGLEPWGAAAARDLASAGLGALHLLDDRPVTADDLAAVRSFAREDLGRGRAEAVGASLARAAPGCAVTTGALRFAPDCVLALDDVRWDLILACLPGDDLLALQGVARFAEGGGVPSLGAHLDGLDAVIGPGVVPGETACWECCRLRRLAVSDRPEIDHALHAALLAERQGTRAHTYFPPMPALLGHALALAAMDLLERPGAHPLRGRLLVQNLITMETELHTVLRMPHCPVCGGAFVLGGAASPGNGADLSLARDPEELRRMLAGVVDRRTGIVRHLIVSPSASPPEPELPIVASALLSRYTEGTPACSCAPELGSGKGTTHLAAMVSAVGEAVERYSASRFHRRAWRRGPVTEMEGDLLAPADLCPYAEHQYADPGFPFARLSPGTPIDWARGFWLDTRREVLVPALPTYFNYPAPPEEHFCEVTSNGLAAGPTLDAAALSAALELCERDAFMITWLARLPGRRVLLDASVSAEAREAARQLEERGVRVELYLLDAGVGVPAIACVGYGDGERWPGATVSLAAHLDPRAAIAKAVLEQGHVGPYLCRLVADGKRTIPERPEDVRTLEDHALYYVPRRRVAAFAFLGAGGEIGAADLPAPEGTSIDALCRRLAAAGLRIAIVDVTAPDLAETPLRVARALGKGFQQIHFGHPRARLGNPRLLAMATHGLNPDPHPMA